MDRIPAIETYYNGYKFRSRLEARWAVFFDSAGIKYQYEPEGFTVDDGYKKYFYLPDFYLPEYEWYAEVKPNRKALEEERVRYGKMIDFCATPISKGLLILGQIPSKEDTDSGILAFPFYYWDSGVCDSLASFIPVCDFHGEQMQIILHGNGGGHCETEELPLYHFPDDLYAVHDDLFIRQKGHDWKLRGGSKKYAMFLMGAHCACARQARFEFNKK